MRENQNQIEVEVRQEPPVPYACEFNCRGEYDEGGFACHKAQICDQFGRF